MRLYAHHTTFDLAATSPEDILKKHTVFTVAKFPNHISEF